jgi:hypothetical protein
MNKSLLLLILRLLSLAADLPDFLEERVGRRNDLARLREVDADQKVEPNAILTEILEEEG